MADGVILRGGSHGGQLASLHQLPERLCMYCLCVQVQEGGGGHVRASQENCGCLASFATQCQEDAVTSSVCIYEIPSLYGVQEIDILAICKMTKSHKIPAKSIHNFHTNSHKTCAIRPPPPLAHVPYTHMHPAAAIASSTQLRLCAAILLSFAGQYIFPSLRHPSAIGCKQS